MSKSDASDNTLQTIGNQTVIRTLCGKRDSECSKSDKTGGGVRIADRTHEDAQLSITIVGLEAEGCAALVG